SPRHVRRKALALPQPRSPMRHFRPAGVASQRRATRMGERLFHLPPYAGAICFLFAGRRAIARVAALGREGLAADGAWFPPRLTSPSFLPCYLSAFVATDK